MKKGVAVLTGILGFAGGAFITGKMISNISNEWKNKSDKNFANVLLLNQWMMVKQSGKNLKDYFEKNNYKRIVIYGMGYSGERLVDELKDTGIEVIAGVDRNAKGIFSSMPVQSPEETIPDADCMVVTTSYFFDEIADKMSKKCSYPIISLEDILYEA